jgi:SAM-dependent methyltransferase
MNPAEFANIAKSEETLWWYRGMKRILFRLLDPVARNRMFSRVLEGGCGTGHLSKVLAERYGWRLYPVDLGWDGLSYGRAIGVPRLAQADISRLPFRDSAFDLVISMDVLVHFPRGSEMDAVRELVRTLSPGGYLAIRVSALDLLHSRHSMFAGEKQRFTRARLIASVEECGIKVIRCTYANSLLLPVSLAKFRLWEPLLNRPPASGVEPVAGWLDSALHFPLAIEAACIGAGMNFPLGQSIVLVGQKR